MSTEPTLRVTFLTSDRVVLLPVKLVLYWKQAVKFFELAGPVEDESTLDGREFTVTSLMSDAVFDKIVEFTRMHLDIKVTHIPGPTYYVVNPTKDPWNVPKWAFEWAMQTDPFTLCFDILEAADALQFAPLVELMGFVLAQVFVSMTLRMRNVVATGSDELTDEYRREVLERHKDWANDGSDVPTIY